MIGHTSTFDRRPSPLASRLDSPPPSPQPLFMKTTRRIMIALCLATALGLAHCAVPATQTTITESDSVSTGTQLYIVGDGVRLRAGPGTNHAIVGRLNRGDPVNVLFGSGAWCALETQNDTVWVHANLVGSQDEALSR